MARKAATQVQTDGAELRIEHVPMASLRPDPSNPRTMPQDQFNAVCRSLVEFGIVDPLVVRREDNTIIGGHQRYRAIERLLAGPFEYRTDDGERRKTQFKLPTAGVPVVFVEGLSEAKAKLLNLALNRISGEWDHDSLAQMLVDLHDNYAMRMSDLMASGFGAAEITDYLDLAREGSVGSRYDDGGEVPGPATQAPKLSLEFTSAAARDAVKRAISAAAKDKEPSGMTLARMLDVRTSARGKAAK